jgi:hypothetical protein
MDENMNRQYQKYLKKTKQEAPKATGKKYFTVPKEYKEETELQFVKIICEPNTEKADEEC